MRTLPTADWIFRHLRRIPGAVVRQSPDPSADLVFEFGEGPSVVAQVVSLTRTGTLSIAHMVDGLAAHNARGLLLYATPTLRPALRKSMAAKRLSWIERSGAVHLDYAPYFIHDVPHDEDPADESTAGRPDGEQRPAKLVGNSGTCAEAILLWWLVTRSRPDELPALTQTTLAGACGVTPPLAGRVLHRLESLDALVPERTGKRTVAWRITNPERVLETWVREDRPSLRVTRLYLYARHAGEMREKLARLAAAGHPCALGGVAAANTYAPTLTADPIPTVWIADHRVPVEAAHDVGAEIVNEGSNLVFWQAAKDSWQEFSDCSDDAPDFLPPTTNSTDAERQIGSSCSSRDISVSRLLRDTARRLTAQPQGLIVPMVSPVRALQQTMLDTRGRSDQVALALSERLGLTSAEAGRA